jgi:hypothetical protein
MPHGMADVATTVHTPEGTRFNMKCLDYSVDETYFTSVQAEAVHRYAPSAEQPNPADGTPRAHPLPSSTEGTLRLCSLSVVFEPKATHLPMIRVPFKELEVLEEDPETAKARAKAEKKEKSRKSKGGRSSGAADGGGADGGELNYSTGAQAPHVVVLGARGHFEMKPHGHSSAYPPLRSASTMRILLHGPQARTAAALTLLLELWAVHRRGEEDYDGAQAALSALIASRESLVPSITSVFDPNSETTLLSLRACRVTPFASTRGRLTLSSSAIYFQPFVNSPAQAGTGDGTLRQAWPTLHYCLPRRYISRGQAETLGLLFGYELYFSQRKSLLVVFDTDEESQEFKRALTERAQPPNLSETTAEALQQEWSTGSLSNFDYLVALNLVCGRSFNDLAQYPVMPWVIADYTSPSLDLTDPGTFRDLSKPVGALTPERLKKFWRRHEEEGWMYGSHYSSPSTVMLFLLRRIPDAFLHLQSGRFGASDRLFHSVDASWRSSLESDTDVKELVPEFYNTSEEVGEFLLNGEGLDLGKTQEGRQVNDVALPPWASDSRDFVAKCRAALESPIATAGLPRWIDLVFGCALPFQSSEAHAAANLFYPITYQEHLLQQLQNEQEPMMRAAYLSQAYEFGRCPSQAFTEPHPPKQTTAATAAAAGGLGTAEPAATMMTAAGQGDGGGDGDVVMAVVAPNDAESAGSEAGKPQREGEANAAASADTTAGADGAAAAAEQSRGGNGHEQPRTAMAPPQSSSTAAAAASSSSSSSTSTRLRTSMRQLQHELNKAGSELTVREAEWDKQRLGHRDTCASLARWYREKQRTLESGRWEMSLTARLADEANRHDVNAAQWEGEKSELVRRLEMSETRQRELVVQTERMRQKVGELKRTNSAATAATRTRSRTASNASSMSRQQRQGRLSVTSSAAGSVVSSSAVGGDDGEAGLLLPSSYDWQQTVPNPLSVTMPPPPTPMSVASLLASPSPSAAGHMTPITQRQQQPTPAGAGSSRSYADYAEELLMGNTATDGAGGGVAAGAAAAAADPASVAMRLRDLPLTESDHDTAPQQQPLQG